MIKIINKISIIASVIILSSCSVYKAASNEGVLVRDISRCKNKGCFLSYGMDILNGHVNGDGTYTETYRAVARKNGGNYVRAVGHGVLDVATLGLWEVAGTPVEGAISNNRGFITVIATYAHKETGEISHMEIYNAHGNKVEARK